MRPKEKMLGLLKFTDLKKTNVISHVPVVLGV